MNVQKKRRGGCFLTGCLTLVAVPFLIMAIAWALVSWGNRLPDRFVLRLPVSGSIDEHPAGQVPFPLAGERQGLSLQELMTVMDRARTDERVRSVLLEIDGLSTPAAKIGQLRRSIEALRGSGKKVTAFLRSPEDKDYLLAVACDSVVVQQGSWMLLDGLKAESFFFAEPLGRLGIGFQASQWKKYKSAIEPFTRSSSSPESREELSRLLDASWDDYLGYVSARRGVGRDAFAGIVDSVAVLTPEHALARRLVDRVSTAWKLEKEYEKRYGAKAAQLFVGGHDYLQATGGLNSPGRGGRVAVVNVTGPISSGGLAGMAEGEGIDEATLQRALQSALDDRDVKAIVLRIDSPGGEAVAASNMLEMLDAARRSKPIVASMSGVAASGGYMVALGADRILCEPMTVTGSIGVFSLKPDLSGLLKKIGLNREALTRGRFADANTPFKPLDEAAFRKFDETSGVIYRDFVGKVAARRKIPLDRVDAVAGGRVWTGRRALDVGLVDQIGGLDDAVRVAWKLARMDDSKRPGLVYLPAPKSWFEYLSDGNASLSASVLAARLAETWLRESSPVGLPLPGTATARFLLRQDRPQVLAIDPVEVVVK
ncbi:MAG: signal peptide peptidase SppA [Chlorobiaceae bacterium]|nr:signal peptide peptidase SppA [Chlorobiaceae bacterium]